MGWTSGDGGREAVTERQKGPWNTRTEHTVEAIRHHRHGMEDWFLYEVRKNGMVTEKFIQVSIWDGNAHKEMDAIMHPYFYNCPVEWLALVPMENPVWRTQVRIQAGVPEPEDEAEATNKALAKDIRQRFVSVENGAEVRIVDDKPVVDMATCGTCGLSWNDELMSSRTPAHSGRCPYEYEHEEIAFLKRRSPSAYRELVRESQAA